MIHSCGAVLYTIKCNRVYLVLGKEGTDFFHFKGCREFGETFEETAIREIQEETIGIVNLKNINLDCNIKSKRKKYHLGLIYVNNDIVKKFNDLKEKYKNQLSYKYKEKKEIRLFSLNNILTYKLHPLTLRPILYYYKRLELIQKNLIYNINNNKNELLDNENNNLKQILIKAS